MIQTSKINNITVCSDCYNSVETVSIIIMIKSGGILEDQSNFGISHFLEHMAFKGTTSKTLTELAIEFDILGGNFNAYTGKERTVYYAKVLKEDAEKAFKLLADIILNCTFPKDELEKERKVILQELAQTEDAPDDIVFDYFQETAFANQALGSSILGSKEFILKVSRDEIIQFMNKHYTSANIYIAAAGNITHQSLENMVANHFIIKTSNDKPDVFPKSIYTPGSYIKKKELQQVNIVLGFKGVSYKDEDYYIQAIAATIAGGGMSSRLFQEIREKRGLSYTISSFTHSYHDIGLFGIYSSTEPEDVEELINVSCEELLKLSQKITEEELERAKMQILSGLLMSLENPSNRAEKLASNIAFLERYISVKEIRLLISKVTTKDIKNYFAKILLQNDPTFACIGDRLPKNLYEKIIGKFKGG